MTADPIKTTGSAPDPAMCEAFLTACRHVEGRALEWLTKDNGITPEVVIALASRERTGQVFHLAEQIRVILDKVAGSLNPEAKDFDKTVRELFPILIDPKV